MFCQANKPNIGMLQEEKPFCYRATHFITGKLDSLFSRLQVRFSYAARGFWKEITYLKANYQGLVHFPQKAESLKQYNTLTCKQNQQFSGTVQLLTSHSN